MAVDAKIFFFGRDGKRSGSTNSPANAVAWLSQVQTLEHSWQWSRIELNKLLSGCGAEEKTFDKGEERQ